MYMVIVEKEMVNDDKGERGGDGKKNDFRVLLLPSSLGAILAPYSVLSHHFPPYIDAHKYIYKKVPKISISIYIYLTRKLPPFMLYDTALKNWH